jgi:ABC-2 type transport system permease protein
MIGYVVVAALSFFFAYAYCMYNVRVGYPYFGIALSSMVVYLLILVPILTMRSLSDERKTKTDQLLLTSPVSVTGLVLGKYLAMLCVLGIPMLISCIYPILLAQQTYHSLLIDYCSILAYFILGGVYIAIGMFISSLTESQIISAVISFAVFYVMSIMTNLTSHISDASYVNAIGFVILAFVIALLINHITKNLYAACMCFLVMAIAIGAVYYINNGLFVGAIASILNALSFSNGISYFANGIFNVQDLVLYLSVIFLFVFLTVQSVQKRRWN